MPVVMPSQIVDAIDNSVGNSKPEENGNNFGRDHASHLAALADLVDAVPDELLAACSATDYVDLIQARGIIRQMCRQWEDPVSGQMAPMVRGNDVAKVIRRVMAAVPDENPPANHAGLAACRT